MIPIRPGPGERQINKSVEPTLSRRGALASRRPRIATPHSPYAVAQKRSPFQTSDAVPSSLSALKCARFLAWMKAKHFTSYMSASRCHHGHQKAPQMYVIASVFAIITNTLCTIVADGDCAPSESPPARIVAAIGERQGSGRQMEDLCPRLLARGAVRVSLDNLPVLIDSESTPATWKDDATEVTSWSLPCCLSSL